MLYVCTYVCVCVCVCVSAGSDPISDKTKCMHSEDSDKLVNLSSLSSLHLRHMGNEHNMSLSY